mmetsp:Transcript_177787/g.570098  ORF Transcript_177787/g.570098 Transcript_177787/m.570098 type:complete len:305 (-) Transcript_177787:456-1370(-)
MRTGDRGVDVQGPLDGGDGGGASTSPSSPANRARRGCRIRRRGLLGSRCWPRRLVQERPVHQRCQQLGSVGFVRPSLLGDGLISLERLPGGIEADEVDCPIHLVERDGHHLQVCFAQLAQGSREGRCGFLPILVGLPLQEQQPGAQSRGRCCLAIDISEAHEVEGVAHQRALDLQVQRRVRCQARTEVHLQKPRLQVLIDEDVEAVQLEAISVHQVFARPAGNRRLDREQRLHDEVVDAIPHQVDVGADVPQVPVQRREAPLVPVVVFVEPLVLHEVVCLLVDGIVRQVTVPVSQVLARGAVGL